MLDFLIKRPRLLGRAVLSDPKNEAAPLLIGMGVEAEQLIFTSPLDARARAWDVAAEFINREHAAQLASMLISDSARGTSEPYWVDTARNLLGCLIENFQQSAPGQWRLNDLVELCCATPGVLANALSSSQRGYALVSSTLSQPSAAQGLHSTLSTALEALGPVASASARLESSFTIEEWFEPGNHSVLLLGSDPESSAALAPLNRLLIQRIVARLLAGEERKEGEDLTVFAIDELTELGRLPALEQLTRMGRSKGARGVFVSQSHEALQACYGREGAGAFLGNIENVGFTHPGSSTETRKLAEQLVGEVVERANANFRARGARRQAFDSSSFNSAPMPSRKRGIYCLAKAAELGFWEGIIRPRFSQQHLWEPSRRVAGYKRVGPEQTLRLALERADYRRLGLSWPAPERVSEVLQRGMPPSEPMVPEERALEQAEGETQQARAPTRRFRIL